MILRNRLERPQSYIPDWVYVKSRNEYYGTVTYAFRPACANFIRQAIDVPRVSHEDCCLDHVHGRGREENSSVGEALVRVASSTESVVENLTALYSKCQIMFVVKPGKGHYPLTWEYPTKTSFVVGHRLLYEFTAEATAFVPVTTELA